MARIKNKGKNRLNNSSDPEKWVQILVKDSTRLAIKDYSNLNGLKMWAFVDLAVSDFIERHNKFIPSAKMVQSLEPTQQNKPELTQQIKPKPTQQSKQEPKQQKKIKPAQQNKPKLTHQSKPEPTSQKINNKTTFLDNDDSNDNLTSIIESYDKDELKATLNIIKQGMELSNDNKKNITPIDEFDYYEIPKSHFNDYGEFIDDTGPKRPKNPKNKSNKSKKNKSKRSKKR